MLCTNVLFSCFWCLPFVSVFHSLWSHSPSQFPVSCLWKYNKCNCIWQWRSVCLCLVWLMFWNDLSSAKWLLSMSCLIGRELSEIFIPTSWKGEISDYANFAFALESQKLISLFFLHPRHVTGNFRPEISCFFSTRPLSVILSLYLYLYLYLSLYLSMCESTATVVKSPEQIIGAQSSQIL